MKNFYRIFILVLLLAYANSSAQENSTKKKLDSSKIEAKTYLNTASNFYTDSTGLTSARIQNKNRRKLKIKNNYRIRNRIKSDTIDEVTKAFRAERKMQKRVEQKKKR